MVAASTVWVVTGATRGMGLEFCTQVGLEIACSAQRFDLLRNVLDEVCTAGFIATAHKSRGGRPARRER